jgi:hypothetical protein
MRPTGWGNFSILMLTQSILKNDMILLHAILGYNYLRIEKSNDFKAIWGLGTQIHIHDCFHFVGEVFSGDPYVAGAGTAVQLGFRHFMSDFFQIDMTIGNGFGGSNPMPLWITTGLRMVTDWIDKRARAKTSAIPRF